MSIFFNMAEILEMAEQIERNGAAFYRKAAAGTSDSVGGKLLLELAEMEDDHEKTFAAMRSDLSGKDRVSTVFDPQGEAALYLQAMADGNVFDTKADPSAAITGEEPLADILRVAIGLEKDSIVFYLGLKDLVPPEWGKGKMDRIIREEMAHITLLNEKLKARG